MAFAHLFPIGAARQRGYAAAFFDVASPRRIEAPTNRFFFSFFLF
jgi:hypothetical protein